MKMTVRKKSLQDAKNQISERGWEEVKVWEKYVKVTRDASRIKSTFQRPWRVSSSLHLLLTRSQSDYISSFLASVHGRLRHSYLHQFLHQRWWLWLCVGVRSNIYECCCWCEVGKKVDERIFSLFLNPHFDCKFLTDLCRKRSNVRY